MSSAQSFIAKAKQARSTMFLTAVQATTSSARSNLGKRPSTARFYTFDPQDNATALARYAFCAYLMIYMRSIDVTAVKDNWDCLLFTFLSMADPEYNSLLRGIARPELLVQGLAGHFEVWATYLQTRIRRPVILNYVDSVGLALEHAANAIPNYAAINAAFVAIEALDFDHANGGLLPSPTNVHLNHDIALTYGLSLNCLMGIIVYLSGKNITTVNIAAITVNRPAALARKYPTLSASDRALMSGNARMSDNVIIRLCAAWQRHHAFTKLVVRAVAPLKAHIEDEQQGAFATTALMLEWSGLAPLGIISDMLVAHPKMRNYPPIQAEIAVFFAGVEALDLLPSLEVPFAKVIYRDTLKIAPQRAISTLYGISLAAAAPVIPSLANLVGPANAAASKNAYDTWASGRIIAEGRADQDLIDRGIRPAERDDADLY